MADYYLRGHTKDARITLPIKNLNEAIDYTIKNSSKFPDKTITLEEYTKQKKTAEFAYKSGKQIKIGLYI